MVIQDQFRLWVAVAFGGLLLGPPLSIKVRSCKAEEVPAKLLGILDEKLAGLPSSVALAGGPFQVFVVTAGAQPTPWQNGLGFSAVRMLDRVRCEMAALPALCGGRLVEWDPDYDKLLYLGGSSSSIEVVVLVREGTAEEVARRGTYGFLPWNKPEDLISQLFERKRSQIGGSGSDSCWVSTWGTTCCHASPETRSVAAWGTTTSPAVRRCSDFR